MKDSSFRRIIQQTYFAFSHLIAKHPRNKNRQGRALRVNFSLDGFYIVDKLLNAGKEIF